MWQGKTFEIGIKTKSVKDYKHGSLTIFKKENKVNRDGYTKRERVFDFNEKK